MMVMLTQFSASEYRYAPCGMSVSLNCDDATMMSCAFISGCGNFCVANVAKPSAEAPIWYTTPLLHGWLTTHLTRSAPSSGSRWNME